MDANTTDLTEANIRNFIAQTFDCESDEEVDVILENLKLGEDWAIPD